MTQDEIEKLKKKPTANIDVPDRDHDVKAYLEAVHENCRIIDMNLRVEGYNQAVDDLAAQGLLLGRGEVDALRAENEGLEAMLLDVIDELDGIICHYHPVGRGKDDLSLAREIMAREDIKEFYKKHDGEENHD